MNTYSPYYDPDSGRVSMSLDEGGSWLHIQPVTARLRKHETEVANLRAELEKVRKSAVLLYNLGYRAGHEATVEACYVDIVASEMETYHADVIEEICAALNQEVKR